MNGVSVGVTVSGVEFQIKAPSSAINTAEPTVQQLGFISDLASSQPPASRVCALLQPCSSL